jgi:hypothetical protein
MLIAGELIGWNHIPIPNHFTPQFKPAALIPRLVGESRTEDTPWVCS